MSDTILQLHNINKTFPGVKALIDVNFDVKAGEVHALVGENGAGKSTLVKIMSGVYQRDSGSILYQGEEFNIHNPKQAQEAGICIVHQELNLMPDLTLAQNMFIGREGGRRFFFSDNQANEEATKMFSYLHLSLHPRTRLGDLTVAMQQMVEIAKALTFDSKVLVMDEPTAALSEAEIDELFRIIGQLKEKGVGIVYISHRMEELFQISDRITVMRDGAVIGTKNVDETDMDDIIHMMVGRKVFDPPKTQNQVPSDAPVVLKVTNLYSSKVKDVSFELKKGEILGFAGLVGAGRTEVARLIFGADRRFSGTLEINGKPALIKHPQDAVKYGIGYLSEDRKRYGLAVGLPMTENTTLVSLKDFTLFGLINKRKESQATKEYVDKLGIKTPGVTQLIKFLSGGNQQKVVIAKWLLRNCDILIFDEPTRGIDVGAKSEIYKLMNSLVALGKSIIMISSDLPELLRMSDRILVMCEGYKTAEMDIGEASQTLIMKYATSKMQSED